MKAIVTQECTGCGICVDAAPDVFEMDGDMAKVKIDPLPEDQIAATKDAAAGCPAEAIKVE